jgi:hypothetical protein
MKNVFKSGINPPPNRSDSTRSERRTDTHHTATLAEPAALGHRVSNERHEAGAQHFAHATPTMSTTDSGAEFEQLFLPHMDAAYNLARLVTRNAHDAEDVVQEAYLKAFRAFPRFHGKAARPWLLTIVRNTAFSWL